jgi:hypothetical protein
MSQGNEAHAPLKRSVLPDKHRKQSERETAQINHLSVTDHQLTKLLCLRTAILEVVRKLRRLNAEAQRFAEILGFGTSPTRLRGRQRG